IRCEDPADLDKVIEEANSINDRPVVVDFIVHEDAMVWPMVAAGTYNDEIMAARDVRPDFGDNEDDGAGKSHTPWPSTRAPSIWRTLPASSPGSPPCSPAAASTSTRSPSVSPSTRRSPVSPSW